LQTATNSKAYSKGQPPQTQTRAD